MLQEGQRLKAGRRRGDRHRRDPRPGGDRRPDRRTGRGAPPDRVPRRRAGGDGPRRRARPAADRRPGGRTGPHQRPGQPQCQALSGRRGTAARRHQRHHHAQHPAPGEPVRHRRTGHRRKVKERVPDYVVRMADQIVNVDLSAEDLRERLAAGKIYPAETVRRRWRTSSPRRS